MASVFKRKRDKANRLASWYIAYSDENGVRRTVKGCPDKSATEAIARKLESEEIFAAVACSTPKTIATPPTKPSRWRIILWLGALICWEKATAIGTRTKGTPAL